MLNPVVTPISLRIEAKLLPMVYEALQDLTCLTSLTSSPNTFLVTHSDLATLITTSLFTLGPWLQLCHLLGMCFPTNIYG